MQNAERALRAALRDQATGGGLAAVSGELACVLVPGGADEEELFALAERMRAVVSEDLAASSSAASDGPCQVARPGAPTTRPAARWRRASSRAARRSTATPSMLRTGTGGARTALATYQDLGSFQLLLALQDDDALRLFCDSILGPIESGDGHYGGELMRSLEAFIECNGQWEKAANGSSATATRCATGCARSRS